MGFTMNWNCCCSGEAFSEDNTVEAVWADFCNEAPHLIELYSQCTKCACLHGNIGCFCQGATKSSLSPLCAIMLMVDSKSVISTNECKPIVPSLGQLEENMVLCCCYSQKRFSRTFAGDSSV